MWRALLPLCLCACALTVGEDELDVTPTGQPVAASSRPFLPWLLRDVRILSDAKDRPWLAARTVAPTTDATDDVPDAFINVSVVSLTPPYTGYKLARDAQVFFPPSPARSFCTYRPDGNESFLVSFQQPGEVRPQEFLTGKSEPPQIICGQRAMAFFTAPSKDPIDVLRRTDDGRLQYSQLPWPFGARTELQQGPLGFDDTEQVLLATDGDYRTIAYYLETGDKLDLGVLYWGQSQGGRFVSIDLDGEILVLHLKEQVTIDAGFRLGPSGQVLGLYKAGDERFEVITCDWDGVRAVRLPGPTDKPPRIAEQRVIDETPCYTNYSQLPLLSSLVLYSPAPPLDKELRAVRLDGKEPRSKLLLRQSGQRLLGLCQDQAVAYSLDPPERYGPQVSDGWIGGYRFMERGRDLRFAPDCSRLFFKEHAANVRKLGELRMTQVPKDDGSDEDGLPQQRRLARNVGWNRMLSDGRLLAVTDLGVVGPQNRLLLFDEKGETAEALVHSINAVTGALSVGALLPERREILLEVKDTAPGRQAGLMLLTLPPAKH